MTKLIIYVLTIFLSGVTCFYIAVLWYKSKKYLYEKRNEKLKPEITELINGYIKSYMINNNNSFNNEDGKTLKNNSFEVKNTAIKKLKGFAKKDASRIIIENSLFSHDEAKDKTIHRAVASLGEEIGLVKHYTSMLNLKDHHKVAEAAEKLGKIRSKKSTEALLNVLKRGNAFESYNALLSLAKIGEEEPFIQGMNYSEGTEYLTHRSLIHIIESYEGALDRIYVKMVKSHNSYIASLFIKSASNIILSNKNLLNKKAINHIKASIMPYLNCDNKELKIATIKFLGNLKEEELINKISQGLKDDSWEVRAVTAKALGNFSKKTEESLLSALRDKVWTVRYNAAFSLMNSKDYLKYLNIILDGKDNFAKDIIIAVLDNTKKIEEIRDKEVLNKIKHHINTLKEKD